MGFRGKTVLFRKISGDLQMATHGICACAWKNRTRVALA